MSCGVMSDSVLVTPGLRCEPSLRANAERPAAVRPPFGSFSRVLAGPVAAAFLGAFFLEAFLAIFWAARLRPVFFAGRFFAAFFFEAFDAMRMLSTRLGYGRPARRARAFAVDFCADVKCLDFFPARLRGFARFQGARGALAIRTQRRNPARVSRRSPQFTPIGRGTVERSIASRS